MNKQKNKKLTLCHSEAKTKSPLDSELPLINSNSLIIELKKFKGSRLNRDDKSERKFVFKNVYK